MYGIPEWPEACPPLPDLEISDFTKKVIDQQSVDRALSIVYERSPHLFARFAEREREFLGVEDYAEEFKRILREAVRKEVNIPTVTAMGSLMGEARRRSRLMYGLLPRQFDVRVGIPSIMGSKKKGKK